ncbi:glycosyl transferase [Synechococcus sp. GFB01]|uniref:glycosyl transferase n=1 Tax=Synechococcus sp. GFB01 TaxID=1662190 RepID=UPI00064F6982|nr:glycosyl transferase [Synechococcus sp. GFB01]KMM17381.1 glycosyl transferase [Synechococcus sp. GFB01]
MALTPLLSAALPAALLSWAATGLMLPWLRRSLLDHPNARSAHLQPTPRGGGLGFVLVSSAWALPRVPLLCLPLAIVGFLDDRVNLPASWRYSAQLLTAMALLASAALPLPSGWLRLPLLLVLLVAITAVINFVNFTDGLDGLVAGCGAVLFAVAGLSLDLSWAWVLAGSLVGFLVWNWSPAKVFMGDVGSTYIGAAFAGAALQAPSALQALGLLLVGFPLLGDACSCVLRRLAAGHPVFQAHRLHLFQRLHQAGWAHRRVALLYIGATTLLGAGLLLGGFTTLLGLIALEALVGLALDRWVAVPWQKVA